jgi:hypothetical protein
METFICPHCGQEHASGTRFCPRTGLAIDAPSVCPSCGKPIEIGWRVCANCGQPLTTSYSDATRIMMAQSGKSVTLGRISRYGVLALVLVVVIVFSLLIFRAFGGTTVEQPPTSKPPASNLALSSVPTIASSSQVNPTSVIELQPQPTPFATSATATQCDGDKWTYSPVALYRYPKGNGVDLTIVDVGIHNGSDKYWGSTRINFDSIYITTEGGFTYTPFNYFYDIPDEPHSPYSGTTYNQYNRIYIGTYLLPPGFTTLGFVGNDVSSGQESRFTFGFEVASSQKVLTLHIQNLSILCENPNAQYAGDRLPEVSYPLDKLSSYVLPTSQDYPELGSKPIVVPNVGTFTYKGETEQEGLYVLHFSFTNANAGFATNGNLGSLVFLVGDDGLFRPYDGYNTSLSSSYGAYDAGPAQTVDIDPVPFKVPANTKNLKFVFEDQQNKVYEVYDFSPGQNSDSTSSTLVTSPEDQYAKISGEVVEVNLRRTPGYANKNDLDDVIVKIPSGATVKLLKGPQKADGLNWWFVEWNGYEGWIAERTRTGRTVMIFSP